MPTDRELLKSLRDGFEQLKLFDRARLNSLRDRGQMIIYDGVLYTPYDGDSGT